MAFKNRTHAGEVLSQYLTEFKGIDGVVLAIPRGGVEVAYPVAINLELPLDVIIPRKIGAPGNPELAIGAIADEDSLYIDQDTVSYLSVSQEYIEREKKAQLEEIKKRRKLFSPWGEVISVKNKTVILIDDGIATGSTFIAGIRSLKTRKPAQIIVAVPVAPPESVTRISKETHKVICLQSPFYFMAVGQFYQDFRQTPDQVVIQLLKKARERTVKKKE